MLYVMPRTLNQSRGRGHHISGMITLNCSMPEGRFSVAPISMQFQVSRIPMLLQIWKRCMLQLLQWQTLRLWMKYVCRRQESNKPTDCQEIQAIYLPKCCKYWRQLANHYSAILNSQHNQRQQQYRLLCHQQSQQRNSNQEFAPFTTTEIRAAPRTSRNYTSPCIDDIPNRVLKIPELEGEVTDMLNRHSKALNIENTIPDD